MPCLLTSVVGFVDGPSVTDVLSRTGSMGVVPPCGERCGFYSLSPGPAGWPGPQ